MKNIKKFLALSLCVAIVVSATVMGTLAYLTDQQSVANTFTVGQVDISVDEAKVNADGTKVENADRVTENTYHLIPGQTYTKDPTMTVKASSEEAYIRMLLKINCKSALDEIFAPDGMDLKTIFKGYDAEKWIYEKKTVDTAADTVTYEFRYKEPVEPVDIDDDEEKDDVVLEPLFASFTVPSDLDGEDLKSIGDLTITVEGHAIQRAGFDSDDDAWAAFAVQHQ